MSPEELILQLRALNTHCSFRQIGRLTGMSHEFIRRLIVSGDATRIKVSHFQQIAKALSCGKIQ